MKFKLCALLALSGALFINQAYADSSRNTFSVGYANTKITLTDGEKHDLHGTNFKYRHEFDSNFGLVRTFTIARNEDSQKGYYRGYGYDQTTGKWTFDKLMYGKIRTDKQKFYSFTVGPSYRFNDYISAYAVAGIARTESSISTRHYKTSDKHTAAAYGAGVQIDLINNWVVDVAYDYMKKGDVKANTWIVGVGYHF
ncbi:Ail/Lom family outer membrane beta-barrel protein [Citrobacter amalonaticus]